MDAGLFRFTTGVRVRNDGVDRRGIVHNADYLLYDETGSLEYPEHIGFPMDEASVRGGAKVVIARSETDGPAPPGSTT